MDLGKTSRDNDLLTIFVIGLIRTSRHSFTSHMSYGDYAFSVAGPTLWNRLPEDIRNASLFENFKSVLKTQMFKVAYINK